MSVLRMTARSIALGTVLYSSVAAGAETLGKVSLSKSTAGHKFSYYRIPSAKRLAVIINWPADVSLSPNGREALSYLAPMHMLMGGAEGQSASLLKAEFKDLDAAFNIRTKPSDVSAYFAAPIANAASAAKLANLVIAKPTFGNTWFRRVKSMMLQRYKQTSSTSMARVATASRNYAMGTHPYAQVAPFRSQSTIQRVTHQDIVESNPQNLVTV